MEIILTGLVITKKVKANIFKRFWFWLMNRRIVEIDLRAKGELIFSGLPLFYRTQEYYFIKPIILRRKDNPLFKIKNVLGEEIKEIKLYLPCHSVGFTTVKDGD